MSAPGDNLPPRFLQLLRGHTLSPFFGERRVSFEYGEAREVVQWSDEIRAAHDAEREARLRAEAQVRALEEALGDALEALYEATTTPEEYLAGGGS